MNATHFFELNGWKGTLWVIIYLTSYNEIWFYCKYIKKETKEKMSDTWKRDFLLLSYSIFILNIVGNLNFEAFANIKLKQLGKLVEKAKNYLTEFSELTWKFHQNYGRHHMSRSAFLSPLLITEIVVQTYPYHFLVQISYFVVPSF